MRKKMLRFMIVGLLFSFASTGAHALIGQFNGEDVWVKGALPSKFTLKPGTSTQKKLICNNIVVNQIKTAEGRLVYFTRPVVVGEQKITYTLNSKSASEFCGTVFGSADYQKAKYLGTIQIPK